MAKPRRKKGGRPRQEGPRYPCGKLRPRDQGPTPELIAKRTQLVGERYALHADAGWLMGAMYLRGELTPPRDDEDEEERQEEAQARADIARDRRDAAERFVRLRRQMQALVEVPRPPVAVDPAQTPGRETGDDPVHYARVRAEYLESVAVLADAGADVMQGVIRAAWDEPQPVERICDGLDALHAFRDDILAAGRRAADIAREAADAA